MPTMTEHVLPTAAPQRARRNAPLIGLVSVFAALLLLVLITVLVNAAGGRSEAETRFLAAVQSDGVTLSDDTVLQAGHDVCDGKSIDYIGDANARLLIAGEAFGQLC